MPRKKKQKREDIPEEYLLLDDQEISRRKKIGDMMQSVEKGKVQRIKAEEAERNVIETKAVIGLVTNVFSKFKSLLYASTNKLPAQIVGKDHAETTQIVFKFIDDIFEKAQEDFQTKLSNIKISDEEEEDD